MTGVSGGAYAQGTVPTIMSLDDFLARVCRQNDAPPRAGCESALLLLDRKLNEAFAAAVFAAADPAALRATQRAWLRSKRDTCADDQCALWILTERIGELQSQLTANLIPREVPMTDEEQRKSCEMMAGLATNGQLANLTLKLSEVAPGDMTAAELASVEEFDAATSSSHVLVAIQVRHDARALLANVNNGGTCRSNEYRRVTKPIVRPGEHWPEEQARGEALEDVTDFGRWEQLIALQGRYYLIGGWRGEPEDVTWVTPAGTLVPLCGLGRPEVRREVVHFARSRKLCESVAHGQAGKISWESVSEEDLARLRSRIRANAPGEGVGTLERARVDLDNDGRTELIARVSWSSGAGCGSSGNFLVPLTSDGLGVASDSQRDQFRALVGSFDDRAEIYDVDSTRYVSGAGDDGRPALYKLTPAGADVECLFNDRRVYRTSGDAP